MVVDGLPNVKCILRFINSKKGRPYRSSARCQGRHDLQAVSEDQAVGPIDVVLIELDGLVVLLLGVGEQPAVHVLAGGDFEDWPARRRAREY